ncbi:MAG: helix-turn-helix domain-containing protein [Oscillospiraceae bacterium]|nr:helix-turn-helix domain-containing protein [Oscillospiraceae bacterium]
MSFGTRLQELRHRHGITQEEFAQQLNVSRQAVSKWESSRGYPEMEKLLFICNQYHVTMDELFGDELPEQLSGQQVQEQTEDEQEKRAESPTLKRSLSNFFTNLSPRDQWAFGIVVTTILLLLASLVFLLCTTVAKGASEGMEMKIAWLVLLILFSVAEAVTVGLASIWFAVGALGALLCALAGGGIWLQIGVFLALSGVTLALARPLARKFLTPGYAPTNADRVIGTQAVVIQTIDNLQGRGQVVIAGQTWTARSAADEILPEGMLVRVLRIEGVKVYVTPDPGDNKTNSQEEV